MVPPLDKKASAALAIGSKIRALRQRLNRTLDETAKAAGISKPFLSQVERGQATPSITSLVGIAQALGVTVQYFVDTPTEAKSVCRGDELKFFGLADPGGQPVWQADEPVGGPQAGSDSGEDASGPATVGSDDARRGRVFVRDERPDCSHSGRYDLRVASR